MRTSRLVGVSQHANVAYGCSLTQFIRGENHEGGAGGSTAKVEQVLSHIFPQRKFGIQNISPSRSFLFAVCFASFEAAYAFYFATRTQVGLRGQIPQKERTHQASADLQELQETPQLFAGAVSSTSCIVSCNSCKPGSASLMSSL